MRRSEFIKSIGVGIVALISPAATLSVVKSIVKNPEPKIATSGQIAPLVNMDISNMSPAHRFTVLLYGDVEFFKPHKQ